MAKVSGQRSALNPDAPVFVPELYRRVEDFSLKWWELMKSAAWFRDYWVGMNSEGSSKGDQDSDTPDDLLPGDLDLAAETAVEGRKDGGVRSEQAGRRNGLSVEVDVKALLRELSLSPKSPKEKSPRSCCAAKFQMRLGSPRFGGRRIQQPRCG